MAIHWLGRAVGLISALLGIAGSALLYLNSYAFFPYEGAAWGTPETEEYNRLTEIKNRRATAWQRVGFVLLCLAFAAQAFFVLMP